MFVICHLTMSCLLAIHCTWKKFCNKNLQICFFHKIQENDVQYKDNWQIDHVALCQLCTKHVWLHLMKVWLAKGFMQSSCYWFCYVRMYSPPLCHYQPCGNKPLQRYPQGCLNTAVSEQFVLTLSSGLRMTKITWISVSLDFEHCLMYACTYLRMLVNYVPYSGKILRKKMSRFCWKSSILQF